MSPRTKALRNNLRNNFAGGVINQERVKLEHAVSCFDQSRSVVDVMPSCASSSCTSQESITNRGDGRSSRRPNQRRKPLQHIPLQLQAYKSPTALLRKARLRAVAHEELNVAHDKLEHILEAYDCARHQDLDINKQKMWIKSATNVIQQAISFWQNGSAVDHHLSIALDIVRILHVPDGTVVLRSSETLNHLIVVLGSELQSLTGKGHMSTSGCLADPHRVYTTGQCLGAHALVSECIQLHAVVAWGSCTLAVIDGREFRSRLQAHARKEKCVVRKLIESSAAFEHLHYSLKDELGTHLQPVSYLAGEHVMTEGEVGQSMLFIQTGEVEVRISRGQGKSYKAVATLCAGAVVGEGALFDNQSRRSASVVATSEKVTGRRLLFTDFHAIVGRGEAEKLLRVHFLSQVIRGSSKSFASNLSPLQVTELCKCARTQHYASGAYIVREGDHGSELFIIVRGVVKFEKNIDGVLTELGKAYSGAMFGEGAMCDTGAPRSASCIAQGISNPPTSRWTHSSGRAPHDGVECAVITFNDYHRIILHSGSEGRRIAALAALQKDFEARGKDYDFSPDCSLSDLQVLRPLGVGATGRMFLTAHIATGRTCALKKISLPFNTKSRRGKPATPNTEAKLLRKLQHPFLCALYTAFIDHTDARSCLCMLFEPVLGGDLLKLLQEHKQIFSTQSQLQFYTGQVVEALGYLHRLKIAHRDIKPENLLVANDGYLKLVDFGFAKKCEESETFTLCGTPEYTSPEVYLMVGHSTTADWWSLGVLFHELCTKEHLQPFQGKTSIEIMDSLAKYERLYPDSISFGDMAVQMCMHQTQSLLKGLLNPKPFKRLGRCSYRGDLSDITVHSFFDGFAWMSLRGKMLQPPFIPSSNNRYDGLD